MTNPQTTLSLLEALIVVSGGWNSESERELFDRAREIIHLKGRQLKLDYQIKVLQNEKHELAENSNAKT